ncbi:MobP3 family relaxase [Paludicola sp. MB14-C6]|uniref:MobP3 family relaxase n=1 Tax=Paludihabitans sp. MB14-C6 TaxID=3070656 RepID=UPI0027DDA170|nr:MobP3 family relaxase [Paludicola sp. MB14-C6]WMJ24295.1 MobP3 family relaxase [Paludicola sp. MB14-C6]
MSRVVFKQWIYKPNKKGTPKAISRMLEYIATRPGVELGNLNLNQELKSIDSDTQFEKELYVQYIATRPGVATDEQPHGLFGRLSNMDEMDDIEDLESIRGYVEDLAHSKKTIYNAIISLEEKDAINKEITTRDAWANLINKNINDIAREMGITPRTLEWCGAVHMEKGHPHVHLMYWDTSQTIGINYIDPEKSNTIRKKLIDDLFHDEIVSLRKDKDLLVKQLMEQITDSNTSSLSSVVKAIKENPKDDLYALSQTFSDINYKILNRRTTNENAPYLFSQLMNLNEQINKEYENGAFKYQYLPQSVKDTLDKISLSIIKSDSDIVKTYESFLNVSAEQANMHGGKKNVNYYVDKQKRKLNQDVGNKILKALKEIRDLHPSLQHEQKDITFFDIQDEKSLMNETPLETNIDQEGTIYYTGQIEKQEIESVNENPTEKSNSNHEPYEKPSSKKKKLESADKKYYVNWNKDFKKAKSLLHDDPPNFDDSLMILKREAEKGNAIAMFDIARFYVDGLGVDINNEEAFNWYEKSLIAFGKIEENTPSPYVEYKMGKMYLSALGTTQDLEKASLLLSQSANSGYKYAQYTLGGMYYRGQGVEQSYEKAFELYSKSHEQSFPYASFELGKMYRDGVGVEINPIKANECFAVAFEGFCKLEDESHDDMLQYRIGKMLLEGMGVDEDRPRAITYFEKSAQLNNTFAQYQLAKLILSDETSSLEKKEEAIQWLSLSADGDNQFAQYALGKIYIKGNDAEQNIEKGISLLTRSAEQDNQYAQYTLGKLYIDGADVEQNVDKGIGLLSQSVEQSNQYAQYTLGKLYIEGIVVEQDLQKGINLFIQSAEQGNQFAQYALGKLYIEGADVEQDIKKGVDLLNQSAKQGNQFAQYALGKLYIEGADVKQDIKKGVDLLNQSAEQGNQFAQHMLGKLYIEGTTTVEQNIKKGIGLLSLSVEQGNQFAQYTLGKLYINGTDVEQNVNKGIDLLSQSAEQDNQFAQYSLGKFYIEGITVPQNIKKGMDFLFQSAEQENQFAQYTLGKLYIEGTTIPQNIKKGMNFLFQSAAQENEFAQYTLGKLYIDGTTVPQNIKKGMDFLFQSAAQENQFAQYTLGKLYIEGSIVPQDVNKGLYLLIQSANQGNQFAQYTLGKLYLEGKVVPYSKLEAFKWLGMAAQQDNQYALLIMNSRQEERIVLISLMQGILDTVAENSNRAVTNKNKKINRDMSKALKAEIMKNLQDNSIEWGD